MTHNHLIIERAEKRAWRIWQRRRKLLSAVSSKDMGLFQKQLQYSIMERNDQLEMTAAKSKELLKERGFQLVVFSSIDELIPKLEVLTGTGCWLRSSSRMINYFESYLATKKFIQTDIYDWYVNACRENKIDFYPRSQTEADDYKTHIPWHQEEANDLFSSFKKSLPTGCNSIISSNYITANAEIIITENTGNINHLFSAQKIVLFTADEKLVTSIEMAFLWQSVYYQYGLRRAFGSHTHILSSPHFTDTLPGIPTPFGGTDITISWAEKKKLEFRSQTCIECGLCMEVCPAVEVYGSSFSWNGYAGALGTLKAYSWEGNQGALQSNIWMCNDCSRCSSICPAGFDIFGNVLEIKSRLKKHPGYYELEESNKILIAEYTTRTQKSRVDC